MIRDARSPTQPGADILAAARAARLAEMDCSALRHARPSAAWTQGTQSRQRVAAGSSVSRSASMDAPHASQAP
jgi:hypothetical protein